MLRDKYQIENAVEIVLDELYERNEVEEHQLLHEIFLNGIEGFKYRIENNRLWYVYEVNNKTIKKEIKWN